MHKQLTPVAAALALLGLPAGAPAQAADNQCAACHANVAKDHAGAAHKDLACTTCHTGTEAHLKDMKKRPAVNMDPAQCGACHQQQYKSAFMTSDRPARQSKKAAGGPAPDPFFDRALGGHGFTKEHDLPTSSSSTVRSVAASSPRTAGSTRRLRAASPTRPGTSSRTTIPTTTSRRPTSRARPLPPTACAGPASRPT